MNKLLQVHVKVIALMFIFMVGFVRMASAVTVNVEPDLFAAGTDIRTAFTGVTLSVNGQPTVPVLSLVGDLRGGCGGSPEASICASTGTQVFNRPDASPDRWQFGLAEFRADFVAQTSFAAIDFVGVDDGDVKAEIYDLNGILLDVFIVLLGAAGDNSTATFLRSTADIAYILAGGVPGEAVLLDNLQFDLAPIPIPAALTLFGTGLGILGFIGRRRRRKTFAAE